MNHIMLDLETLDTTSSAVVVSIGAVAFDPYSSALGDRFYVEMTNDTRVQQARGRTISGETVKWWMQQNEHAKRLFEEQAEPGIERTDTFEALERFRLFVGAHGDRNVELWGNGADFDNIILGTLYEDFGMKKPWSYSRNRCYRTMRSVALAGNRPRERHGVHHNALDDAVTQAIHLQQIFANIRQ